MSLPAIDPCGAVCELLELCVYTGDAAVLDWVIDTHLTQGFPLAGETRFRGMSVLSGVVEATSVNGHATTNGRSAQRRPGRVSRISEESGSDLLAYASGDRAQPLLDQVPWSYWVVLYRALLAAGAAAVGFGDGGVASPSSAQDRPGSSAMADHLKQQSVGARSRVTVQFVFERMTASMDVALCVRLLLAMLDLSSHGDQHHDAASSIFHAANGLSEPSSDPPHVQYRRARWFASWPEITNQNLTALFAGTGHVDPAQSLLMTLHNELLRCWHLRQEQRAVTHDMLEQTDAWLWTESSAVHAVMAPQLRWLRAQEEQEALRALQQKADSDRATASPSPPAPAGGARESVLERLVHARQPSVGTGVGPSGFSSAIFGSPPPTTYEVAFDHARTPLPRYFDALGMSGQWGIRVPLHPPEPSATAAAPTPFPGQPHAGVPAGVASALKCPHCTLPIAYVQSVGSDGGRDFSVGGVQARTQFEFPQPVSSLNRKAVTVGFPCGHVYHSVCNPANACVLCFDANTRRRQTQSVL